MSKSNKAIYTLDDHDAAILINSIRDVVRDTFGVPHQCLRDAISGCVMSELNKGINKTE